MKKIHLQIIIITLLVSLIFYLGYETRSTVTGLMSDLDELDSINTVIFTEINKMQTVLDSLESIPDIKGIKVSVYHAQVAQTDDTPNQTADGTYFHINKANRYRFVALSRDLLKEHNGGPFKNKDVVLLYNAGPLSGIYQVRDKMNWESDYAGPLRQRVDILDVPINGLNLRENAGLRLLVRKS